MTEIRSELPGVGYSPLINLFIIGKGQNKMFLNDGNVLHPICGGGYIHWSNVFHCKLEISILSTNGKKSKN